MSPNFKYKNPPKVPWSKGYQMRFNEKRVNQLLFATQGVGAVFVGFFLAAYMAGLPSTDVLHSEPAFRIPIMVFGAVLLVLVLATVILFVYHRKD